MVAHNGYSRRYIEEQRFENLVKDIKLCILRLFIMKRLEDNNNRDQLMRSIVKIWNIYSWIKLEGVPAIDFELGLDYAVMELYHQGCEDLDKFMETDELTVSKVNATDGRGVKL